MKTKLKINPLFLIIWGVLAFADRSEYVLYLFTAAMIHESAHIGAYLTYGAQMEYVEIMPFGLSAKLRNMTDISCSKEIISSLAGIAANLSAALLCLILQGLDMEGIGFFFTCNLWLALINLIPIMPLDGGRALYYLLLKKTTLMKAKKISLIISIILLIPLFIASIWILTINHFNFSLLLIVLYLLFYLIVKKTD